MEQVETISLNDVKTPKTVEEFRENLRKYYTCLGDPEKKEELFVQQLNKVKIDELDSLSDLYGLHPQPMICPKVDWNMDDVHNHMDKTGQIMSCNGFWDDEKNYTLYESQMDHSRYGNPSWFKIDNQILREFYVKTLGDFSGYVSEILN